MVNLTGSEAKVEVQGVNGATPLYVAALNGHKEVLNILLEVPKMEC